MILKFYVLRQYYFSIIGKIHKLRIGDNMAIMHPGPKLDRWNHIFKADGRALIVALDHLPSGLMKGWEFPEKTLSEILRGEADAIMTNFGILKHFSHVLSDKIGRILRLDGGPSYLLEAWPDYSKWDAFYTVSDAINIGADAVIANVFIGGQSEVECLKVAARMAGDCLTQNMPCAFEPIPTGKMVKNEYSPEMLAFSSRMAAEFGADFIKTLYTGDKDSFGYVTSRCPIPILMAGGPKVESDLAFLESVKGMLDGGGRGVFVGRNVWQHENPSGMLRALRKIIHENVTPEVAIEELEKVK